MIEKIFIVALCIGVVLLVLKKLAATVGFSGSRYVKAECLFTRAELSFLGVLQQAVGDHFATFGKVRVADAINVRSGLGRKTWQHAFNAICAKHFDYVICERGSSKILAVIELNDKTHRQRDRMKRDQLLAGICEEVSLPLIQFDAARSYSVADVRMRVLGACQPDYVR